MNKIYTSAIRPALDPPLGPVVKIGADILRAAVAVSRLSPRKRVIQPFHKSDADPLHRMLNAMQPGTYARPHRHLDPPKAESWIILQGLAALVTFIDDGRVQDCTLISAISSNADIFGIDLEPGIWHTVLALEPDTVFFEAKTGPYTKATDKSFAPWAPAEGDEGAVEYLAGLVSIARSTSAK